MANNTHLNPPDLNKTLFNKFIKWQAITLIIFLALWSFSNRYWSDRYLDNIDYDATEWHTRPNAKISYQVPPSDKSENISDGVALKPLSVDYYGGILVETPDGQRGFINPEMITAPDSLMKSSRTIKFLSDSFITIDGALDSNILGKTESLVESKLGDAQIVKFTPNEVVKRYYSQAKVIDAGAIYYGAWISFMDGKACSIEPDLKNYRKTWITKIPYLQKIVSITAPSWGSIYYGKLHKLNLPKTWWAKTLNVIISIILFILYMFVIHVYVLYCVSNIIFGTTMIMCKGIKRWHIILIGTVIFLPFAYICATTVIWMMRPIWLVSIIVEVSVIIGLIGAADTFLIQNRCNRCFKYFDTVLLEKDTTNYSFKASATIDKYNDKSTVTTNESYNVVRYYKCRECDYQWTYTTVHNFTKSKNYSGAFGYRDEWKEKK